MRIETGSSHIYIEWASVTLGHKWYYCSSLLIFNWFHFEPNIQCSFSSSAVNDILIWGEPFIWNWFPKCLALFEMSYQAAQCGRLLRLNAKPEAIWLHFHRLTHELHTWNLYTEIGVKFHQNSEREPMQKKWNHSAARKKKEKSEKKPHTRFWYAENSCKTYECFAWTGFGENSISKTGTLKIYREAYSQTPVFPNFRQSALIYQISDFVNSWDGKSSYGLCFKHVVVGMLPKVRTARHEPKRTKPNQSNSIQTPCGPRQHFIELNRKSFFHAHALIRQVTGKVSARFGCFGCRVSNIYQCYAGIPHSKNIYSSSNMHMNIGAYYVWEHSEEGKHADSLRINDG